MSSPTFHLAIALDGAGWHPAAWREPGSRREELFSPGYWVDLVQEAERGLIDFVTIEDTLGLQSADPFVPDTRTDEVRGRLDALLIASRVAPVTERIGLVPTVTVTHTEPFHVSKAVATLDHVSEGRGGWQVKVSGRSDEAQHFGRRELVGFEAGLADPAVQTQVVELCDEAAEAVEVARRLWDSWEPDAEIRDAATDRFIDAEKVHRIEFEGRFFSVRGPAITPRPPQGQPVVAALAHAEVPYRLAARSADVVFVTPHGLDDARGILAQVAAAVDAERRDPGRERLLVFADLLVFVDTAAESGAARLQRLDGLGRALSSDAAVVTGSAASLAEQLAELASLGFDGVRLRPGVLADDLPAIVDGIVPELQRRGLFRTRYEAATLRGQLGLSEEVADRYAKAVLR
ncbi:LLM class flavin-dependent oxidoreductase [Herbiconiux sp. CPCC 203407]|uniref:LLM class flavin-dependent oxidoreductase n=1 Tax=Herbiconiux oxytropis TaxID=2970915 RepID=A0AA41XJ31_9MICO|nr:LLM class flavin-dependent oxidoreductase [Herbiconiux oxytropis]MCS5723631.1 LLM class flavin-dependent oxidoreductase [Herbiconiux oxytropis]MCS5726948.1 LLM class flavin-dependent oxidoreductase [Herbiconiux oxytropis]